MRFILLLRQEGQDPVLEGRDPAVLCDWLGRDPSHLGSHSRPHVLGRTENPAGLMDWAPMPLI